MSTKNLIGTILVIFSAIGFVAICIYAKGMLLPSDTPQEQDLLQFPTNLENVVFNIFLFIIGVIIFAIIINQFR